MLLDPQAARVTPIAITVAITIAALRPCFIISSLLPCKVIDRVGVGEVNHNFCKQTRLKIRLGML